MALSMFVLKTAEDEETVTYGYGDGPDALSGTVTIEKRSSTPVEEAALPGDAKIALRAIFRGRRTAGEWPHHYTYAA
ncbi:hypothetical protein [Glycomyces harbinensis]|uniref:Uncharacterized protein n=1 Tax=Glycomyces harbinensis TaxID=58114 RepID=A0A1G7B0X2_9ACTN|nr:hypothetical protein [Glycomyces harbinensis]SDE20764.1 hypothetical protein SAMN05216270_11574 [Glycomyces harbinensis]